MMLFYQIHVPKTGGVSIRKYAEENGLMWNWSGGHRSFSERKVPKNAILVTMLRCPIKHTISVYSFWKKHPHLQEEHSLYMAPFSDWLRAEKDLIMDWPSGQWHWFPNLYVSFFGDGNFDKAVANIKSVNYVLDTTHLTEQFNDRIVTKYKLPPFNRHENTSKSFDISKDDADYIRKQRQADFEICKMFGISTL
jgi:hypothetical protein